MILPDPCLKGEGKKRRYGNGEGEREVASWLSGGEGRWTPLLSERFMIRVRIGSVLFSVDYG